LTLPALVVLADAVQKLQAEVASLKKQLAEQPTRTIRVAGSGGGVSDHGLLGGLLGDDHTQYVPVDGIARQLAIAGYPNALLVDCSRSPTADFSPATDGLFLGETTTPRRWDGSKLINLPAFPFEARVGRYHEDFLKVLDTVNWAEEGVMEKVAYVQPFFVPRRMRFDRLACWVTLGRTDTYIYMALYDSNGNAYPNNRLAYGLVAIPDDSTQYEISFDVTLPAGLYWIAFWCNKSSETDPEFRPLFRTTSAGDLRRISVLGYSSLDPSPASMWVYTFSTWQAPPATFPSGAFYMTNSFLLAMRLAEIM